MGSPTTVLLGVDRLDYTKGIDIRLKAFAEVLQDERLDAATTVFVQVAVPSRENISQYQQIRDDIEMLVGRFNGSLATFGATPIHYLRRVLEREELIARSSFTLVLRTQAPASWAKATYSVCTAECRANQPP